MIIDDDLRKSIAIARAIIIDIAALVIDGFMFYWLIFDNPGSNLATAVMITILFISIPVVVLVTYSSSSIVSTINRNRNVDELDSTPEFEEAFARFKRMPVLQRFADTAVRQTHTLDKKTATIEQILRQNFGKGLAEFEVVKLVTEDSAAAVYANLREIYNRMTIFEGIDTFQTASLSQTIQAEQNRMKNEHINFIMTVLNNNEIIFLELDKLMVELTSMRRFGGNSDDDIQKISDIVRSLKKLHDADTSEYDQIAQEYDSVEIPELQTDTGSK